MSDDARPRDYWMCGNPGGCDTEPQWTPLNQQAPYCREHDRKHERLSDILKRSGARAGNIAKRGSGAPAIPRSR